MHEIHICYQILKQDPIPSDLFGAFRALHAVFRRVDVCVLVEKQFSLWQIFAFAGASWKKIDNKKMIARKEIKKTLLSLMNVLLQVHMCRC